MVESKILSGGYLDGLGKPDLAVSAMLWCLDHFPAQCDSSRIADIYTNLSSAYLSIGEYERVIETCTECQDEWARHNRNKQDMLGLLNNKAIAYASMGDIPNAERVFRSVQRQASYAGMRDLSEQALINIGTIFAMNGRLDSAYAYFNQALLSMETRDEYEGRMDLQLNLAILQRDRNLYKDCLSILRDYATDAGAHNDLRRRVKSEVEIAETFRQMGAMDSAYTHINTYVVLNDSLLNEEKIKAIFEVQEKYETVKKEKEINLLKLENLDAALANEKVKRTRNMMYAGAGLLLLTLVVLIGRYRIMRRNRNELREKNIVIDTEKKRSDSLLKNILPDEVAEELKSNGKAAARGYDEVTILFTDFKGFTQIAERMSPVELVMELDICFQSFDRIMDRYGLEKIKTIGDAYMAVCGLPDPNSHHPDRMIRAALEMQDFMMQRKRELNINGRAGFDMRLGIHTGPVVAGVVGEKKFQYDVWGDSVNTASRMESSGEINRVNISEATYQCVKDFPDLLFEFRGNIPAKNKGNVAMYFVSLRHSSAG